MRAVLLRRIIIGQRWERPVGRAGAGAERGRQAERPQDIPKPGWRDIFWRTKAELTQDHVSMVAASIAFYGLLAIFPTIAAMISIWGLVFDPQQITQQIESVSGALPQDAAGILNDQARAVAGGAGAGVSLAAVVGILLALYSASKGMQAMIEGLNIVYDEDEKRGFIKLTLMTLILTIGLIAMMIVALGLIAVLPALLGNLGLGEVFQALLTYARWPLLLVVALVGLAVLYRYAPSREVPQWQWVSPGAVIATVLWLIGSIAFSIYVRNFGSYNETYGSLGAVVILLMWFWLSAFIVLLGAEVNCELERQTERDTTAGRPRPRGERGAYAADTVGERP
jgi:membrane protein